MDSMNALELLLDEPGQALFGFLHHKGSAVLLLVGAALFGIFGLGLAAQIYFRGRSPRHLWGGLAANIGGLFWLLPVAAVFALYGFWMRPSLLNFDGTPPAIPVVSQKPSTPSFESGTSLPDWVHEKETVSANTRFVVVTGEIGGTIDEATAVAHAAAVDLVQDDLAVTFPQTVGWRPPAPAVNVLAVRRSFVEEIDRKTHSSGIPFRVYRAYDQVELSPSVRSQLFPFWRQKVVDRRIAALGGLAGLLTLTFATLSAYFRLDDRTAGLCRRRLKLAAVSVIAAGGFAAATLL